MADDDQSSSIPSMVDGLTRAKRTTILRFLEEEFAKDFSGYIKSRLPAYQPVTTTGLGYRDITLVHPRYVFHQSDEELLLYLSRWDWEDLMIEDLLKEPTWLMPIIPIVLVNGGMGTKYNPWDVIAYFKGRLLKEKEPVRIRPWIDGDIRKKTETTDLDKLLLDTKGRKKKYGSLEELLEEFFTLRLKSYEERKSTMFMMIACLLDELESEADKYDGQICDARVILDYELRDEVVYAGVKNFFSRYLELSMDDIELGIDPSVGWWFEKMNVSDILREDVSVEDLWLNDLNALEEQLNEQYGKEVKGRTPPVSDSESRKQEPCEVRSSSLEEDVSLVQDKDEPKTGNKRIREQDDEEDEAETRKVLRATLSLIDGSDDEEFDDEDFD